MGTTHSATQAWLASVFPAEHARLVRLCAAISGDAHSAEDLAQETLLTAWQLADRLHDTQGYRPWLSAIARNVCRHWLRKHRSEIGRVFSPDDQGSELLGDVIDEAVDIERDLERHELADLLDRALALLPDSTRQALLQQYVSEAPLADIAAQLGLSEGALSMRLQRGKLTLRRVLSDELREETAAYHPLQQTWQQLQHWCPHCGKRQLVVQHNNEQKSFWLRCPDCDSRVGTFFFKADRYSGGAAKSFWPVFTRFIAASNETYRDAFSRGRAMCTRCSSPLALRTGHVGETIDPAICAVGDDAPPNGVRLLLMECPCCQGGNWSYSTELALYSPEGLRFWRAHKRIYTLPEREVETEGMTALTTRMRSADERAQLEVIYHPTRYEVLRVIETNRT